MPVEPKQIVELLNEVDEVVMTTTLKAKSPRAVFERLFASNQRILCQPHDIEDAAGALHEFGFEDIEEEKLEAPIAESELKHPQMDEPGFWFSVRCGGMHATWCYHGGQKMRCFHNGHEEWQDRYEPPNAVEPDLAR